MHILRTKVLIFFVFSFASTFFFKDCLRPEKVTTFSVEISWNDFARHLDVDVKEFDKRE